MTTDWPLTVDPYWSRKLAHIMNDPRIRRLGIDWWDRFLDEAQKVSAIDDLSEEFRDVITPVLGTLPFGEDHPYAKLTEANMVEIFRLWDNGVAQTRIAECVGCSPSHVSNILNSRSRV